jgi:hypothetical protein
MAAAAQAQPPVPARAAAVIRVAVMAYLTCAGVRVSVCGVWSNMASNLACAIVPLIDGPNVAWLGSCFLVWVVLIGLVPFSHGGR